jgi:hypothetical protein
MTNFVHPASTPVILTNTVTGETSRYPSINKAAKALDADQPSLSRAIKHGYKVRKHSVTRA